MLEELGSKRVMSHTPPTPSPGQLSAPSLVPQQLAQPQTGQNNHCVPSPKRKSPCFLAWLIPKAAVSTPNLGPSQQQTGTAFLELQEHRVTEQQTPPPGTPSNLWQAIILGWVEILKLCLHLLPCEELVLQHCWCFPSRNSAPRGEDEKRAGKHKGRTIPRLLLLLSGSICHPFMLFVSPFAVAFPKGSTVVPPEDWLGF